jgi:RNA polymerase sigma-70 factor (ECF subfamily)
LARDEDGAEDLMQEVFVRAINAKSAPQGGAERVYWLYRIATNIAIDHLRRGRRIHWLPLRIDTASSKEATPGEADQVREALRLIPPEQAVTLVLRTQGYSRQEIAKMLQLSEAAVKSRLFRARENFAASYRRLERGLPR